MTQLILATRNIHKARELKTLLSNLDVDVLTLNDISDEIVLREDGDTFEANAIQKARIVHARTKLLSLADDSGLEVFYLQGRPGVFSARYAGGEATDEMNNRKLLEEMRGVAPRRRRAQFRSVLALIGAGMEEVTEGICPGSLGEAPRGTNGFGYDPIFIPDGFDKTYAELTAKEKNLISHRARSFAKMTKVIQSH
ncbi:MAG: RdgB/HAM1 family non-canonical purine NTP pyrophosphatase [Ignavibacteriales bacterium]|nr:RdgB/HAM1 family non-canonical purine NTP pyrophosphatase [Ignavibacteriales bacterium]